MHFLGDCKLSFLESIFVGSKSMVALSLSELPGNTGHVVLAAGGLDNKVHLYCGERTGKVCNLRLIHLHYGFLHLAFCNLKFFLFCFIYASSLFMLVS